MICTLIFQLSKEQKKMHIIHCKKEVSKWQGLLFLKIINLCHQTCKNRDSHSSHVHLSRFLFFPSLHPQFLLPLSSSFKLSTQLNACIFSYHFLVSFSFSSLSPISNIPCFLAHLKPCECFLCGGWWWWWLLNWMKPVASVGSGVPWWDDKCCVTCHFPAGIIHVAAQISLFLTAVLLGTWK